MTTMKAEEKREEIARKHGIIDGFTIHSNPTLAKKELHEAMEEYKDAELKEARDERDKAKYSELCKINGHAMYSVYKLENIASHFGLNKCSRCGYEEEWQFDM